MIGGALRRHALALVAVTALVAGTAAVLTSPGPRTPLDRATARLAALEGHGPDPAAVRFGAQLDWQTDNPAAFQRRAGVRAVVYGEFVEFPFRAEVGSWLGEKSTEVGAADGVLMLTLEPVGGLGSVTDAALADLTRTLRDWNTAGTPVLVRFAHEMNGSWYAWAQHPAAYVATFRRVAAAVHAAPASRILWSPNEGGSYPFAGGRYAARPGTADFAALDTDHDGRLTQRDDPYAPYYPGDDAADWVGMSIYHFGRKYPWGANVPPEPGKFVAKLTGTFAGANGDERPVPDFYDRYARRTGKPITVSETSALFNTGRAGTGATDLQIKQAWMRQVFAPDLPARFPRLRLINWFEQEKDERDVPASRVDWTLTHDPEVLYAFRRDAPDWLVFA
ncbi:MAG TPA: glycosyl hydrolase [Mycobacteriales bacterium]